MNFHALDSHEYRIEDDLLFVRYRGLLTPAHAQRIMELVRGIRARCGRVLVLTEAVQSFTFVNVDAEPVPSLLRITVATTCYSSRRSVFVRYPLRLLA